MKRVIFTICILLIYIQFSFSQEENPNFGHISIEQGLSHSLVNSVIQDNQGFIWFGTEDGLNKYDGYNFTVFRPEPGNPASIQGKWVTKIFKDNIGNLWFQFMNGGLSTLNIEKDKFTNFKNMPKNPYTLSDNRITDIFMDRSGIVWIGTQNGLNRYNRQSKNFTRYYQNPIDSNSLSDNVITVIRGDQRGNLWIGTQNGLNLFNPRLNQFVMFKADPNDSASISGNNISTILCDSKYDIWIGTKSTGLNRIKYNNKMKFDASQIKFQHFIHSSRSKDVLSKSDINVIFEQSNGDIWIGHSTGVTVLTKDNWNNIIFLDYLYETRYLSSLTSKNSISKIIEDHNGAIWLNSSETSSGIFKYEPKSHTFFQYRHNPYDPNSLSVDAVVDFCEDRSGVLWICTTKGGINKLDLNRKGFLKYSNYTGDENTINSNNVYSIYQAKDDILWIGTNKGLNKLNRKEKTVKKYEPKANCFNCISGNIVGVIKNDKANHLWLGYYDTQMSKFSPELETFQHFSYNPNVKNSFSALSIRSILFDSQGTMWIGASSAGLIKLNEDSQVFTYFIPQKVDNKIINTSEFSNSKDYSISDKFINTIYEEKSGTIWVGTQMGGLNKFDKKTGKFKHYVHDHDNLSSISNDEVKSVLEDTKGNLWIGTGSGGLNLMDRQKETFVYFTTKEGLASNAIHGMLEDNHGNLWISTNNGLSKFNPVTKKFRNYYTEDGLQSNEFNPGAYFKNENTGEMFFGGNNGFNSFYPDSIFDNHFIPEVIITDFKILNKPVVIGEEINEHTILSKSISYTKDLTLNHKQYSFTFEFAALHYAYPQNNNYKFKLENFDAEWIYTTSDKRYAVYTNIPAGQYKFIVVASNHDEVWNMEGASINLTILPPWWKTWWFRSLASLAVIISILSFYFFRINSLRKQKDNLEQKVSERTNALLEANSELKERQEEILQQQEEIIAQKDQMEMQFEELQTKNDEIAKQRDVIVQSLKDLQLISEFGKKITSTFDIEAITGLLYDYVNDLMETSAFGVGVYHPFTYEIVYQGFIVNGQVLPTFTKDLSKIESLTSWVIQNREEIFILDIDIEYVRYLKEVPVFDSNQQPKSMILLPLVKDNDTLGVITVNSLKKHAYSEHHLNILRTIGSYVSIAIDNSHAYKMLNIHNENIKSSIVYGRTIQQAILPQKQNIDKFFESFIIYKPKDIVSGDFYWFSYIPDTREIVETPYGAFIQNEASQKPIEKIFLGVVDCTGHGVPGAFMSMIGNRLLNEIVNERKIYQPGLILSLMDEGIKNALNQDNTDNNDGMEVALCAFERVGDLEPNKLNSFHLTFSGAKLPLYYYSNSEKGIRVISPDRQAIGGVKTRRSKLPFNENELTLQHGDILYLISDGIIDLCDEERKKFGTPKLLLLLNKIASWPFEEQKKAIEDAIVQFKQKQEQRDDITIIGIRL